MMHQMKFEDPDGFRRDQRAQLAPGHASKVRVDRLQGRRPLVTQRAQNQ